MPWGGASIRGSSVSSKRTKLRCILASVGQLVALGALLPSLVWGSRLTLPETARAWDLWVQSILNALVIPGYLYYAAWYNRNRFPYAYFGLLLGTSVLLIFGLRVVGSFWPSAYRPFVLGTFGIFAVFFAVEIALILSLTIGRSREALR
jgi:hypothetical protein